MKTAIIRCNDRKYEVYLNDNGSPVAYRIETCIKGRRTTWRLLWSAERHGWVNGDIPQGLKDVLNVRGASEQIAHAMEWTK
jgi:hypothetical protein